MIRIIFIVLLSVLMGCQAEDFPYSYLMTHPHFLQKKSAECQSQRITSKQCETMLSAAVDFNQLLNEQEADPLQFGQRIMAAEVDWVNAKQELVQAKQALQSSDETSQNLARIKNQLEGAEKSYQEISQEVNILLTVVSVNNNPKSPD